MVWPNQDGFFSKEGRKRCILIHAWPLWVFRGLCNANLKNQPILLLLCFIIEGPRWQMFINMIPPSSECYVWFGNRSARPESAGSVPRVGRVILDKPFCLSVSALCLQSQGDASCVFDRRAPVISLIIVSWRGTSVAFGFWNYGSLYLTLKIPMFEASLLCYCLPERRQCY